MKTPSTANNSLTPTKPNTSSNPMNTPKTSRNRTSAIILAGSIAALLAVQSAHAATRTWDGSDNVLWSDAANWDTLPTNDLATDIANFNLATYGSPYVAPFLPNAGTTSINGLTIGSSNGKMILTTANLSIGASGIAIANGAGAFTVAGGVTLGAAQNWVNNSKNHVMIQHDGGDDVVNTNGYVLTIDGTGHTFVGSAITGTGGLTKTGTGIFTMFGFAQNNTGSGGAYRSISNKFSGQFTIEEGTFSTQYVNNVSADGALGNSTLPVILGGSSGKTGILQFTGSLNADVTLNPITITNKAFTMAAGGTGAFEVTRAATNLILNGVQGGGQIGGTGAMTKMGLGTLTISGSASNTFSGGLNVIGGGTLALDFANMGTPTDLIAATNVLTLNGGFMTIKAKTGVVTTAQTFGGVTANAGGGSLLVDPLSAGGTTDVTLGALNVGVVGSSLVLGRANTNTGTLNIITTTNKDAQGIYGGRIVFANGTASTGFDWADNTGGGGPNYTLSAYSGYTPMADGPLSDSNNVSTAGLTVINGALTHNSLKITGGTLDMGANLLTLASGGLLSTGTTVSTISGTAGGTRLTAGAGNELIVHQYNTAANGLEISAVIGDNGNAVSLTKAGTGNLILSGTNTFTGQLTVQGGTLSVPTVNNVSTDGPLGNSASAVIIGNAGRVRYTGSTASSDKPFTMASGGAGSFEVSTGGQTLTLSGVIGGAGGLQMAGPGTGTLKLTGANNYDGVTTISGGTLEVDNLKNAGVASSLGDYAIPGASGIVLNGGTLKYTGTSMGSSIDRGITLTANSTLNLPNSNTDMRIASLTQNVNGQTGNSTLTVSGTSSSRLYIDSVIVPTELYRSNGINITPTTAPVTIGTVNGNGGLILAGTAGLDNIVTGPIHLGQGHVFLLSGAHLQWDHRQVLVSGPWTIMSENTFDGRFSSGSNNTKIKSPGTMISGQNVSYAFGKTTYTNWTADDTVNNYKIWLGNGGLQLLNDVSTSYETGLSGSAQGASIVMGGTGATILVDRNESTTATNQTHKLGNLLIKQALTLTVTGNNGFGLTVGEVRIEDVQTQVITTNTNLTLAKLRKIGTGTNILTIKGTGTTTIAGVVERSGASGTLTLTKSETGTLILNGANSVDGTITVSGGKLVAAHANALGPVAQATTVSSGATLDVRAALVAEPISVTGTGVGGFGALITATANTGTVTGTLTLTGTTSIGGAGTGILNINGIVAAGANTLTTLGTGVTTFGAASTLTSLTNLVVTDGTTNVNSALGTAGNAVVTVSDSPVTKLRFGSVSQTLSSLTIGAGATVIFTSGLASGALTGDDGGSKAAGFGSPASSFGGGATVPEPGTLGLLLVGALGMLNRRRRA